MRILRKTLWIVLAIFIIMKMALSDFRSENNYKYNSNVEKANANIKDAHLEVDVDILSKIAEKIKSSCPTNNFGTEAECNKAITERKDICIPQIVQQYKGQAMDVAKMIEVGPSFSKCIFQK